MARAGTNHRGGRPKGKKAKSTLDAEALKTMYIDMAKEKGLPIARALFKKAVAGDVGAIKEFNDRVFGRAPQSIQHEGEITLLLDD